MNPASNVQGIGAADGRFDADDRSTVHSLKNPALVTKQDAYVRQVVDTVNGFDNVLYEVANEGGTADWQYHVIRLVRDYERTKPKQLTADSVGLAVDSVRLNSGRPELPETLAAGHPTLSQLVAATVLELARRSKRREQMVMAAPALVEAYAVLTRLPPPYRLRPQDAIPVMVGSWGETEVAAMAGADTWPFLEAMPGAGIAGGSTHDAQIAACARSAKVDVILT